MNPRFPVYIISKGRWESRLTARGLEAIGVPYRIVIEPQEFDNYSAVIDPAKILVLPFSNLGQGSIPARNWVWEHSIADGHERHWLLDDNIGQSTGGVIRTLFRFNRNLKVPCGDGTPFVCMEDFAYRHERVAFAGPNYFMFASRKTGNLPAYYVNTRVYSFTLIDNSLPYRWRGRYNEDTDICLRALKDGYRTVLFNAFLCYKQTTMTMAGGNTDTVYVDGDNRLKFAESLKAQHPDVVTVTQKWGRYHHHVDYSPFKKNRLILKPGVVPTGAPNEYGMRLVRVNGTEENKGDSK